VQSKRGGLKVLPGRLCPNFTYLPISPGIRRRGYRKKKGKEAQKLSVLLSSITFLFFQYRAASEKKKRGN